MSYTGFLQKQNQWKELGTKNFIRSCASEETEKWDREGKIAITEYENKQVIAAGNWGFNLLETLWDTKESLRIVLPNKQ